MDYKTPRRFFSVFLNATGVILCLSCHDFVEVDAPVSEIVRETVFTDDRSANAAMSGIYSEMMSTSAFAGFDIGYYCAISADELLLLSSTEEQSQFQNNSLLPSNTIVLSSFWDLGYRYIWYANTAIEGLSNSSDVSPAIRAQLVGEARFIRAFCHFYLTNLFGDIPYITSTDYRINGVAPKIAQSEVFGSIIQDLSDAQRDLAGSYATPGRVRPNRGTATALLARTYLYIGDWANAEKEATKLISDSQYQLVDLNKVFLAGSAEAIWQLMPVNPGYNTYEERYVTAGSNGGLSLTDAMLNSFEVNDGRHKNWIGEWANSSATLRTYYPFKYKVSALHQPVTEYNMVFRLAEQFLIRAEARAHNSMLTGPNSAESDLNMIRNRAGLGNTTAATQEELLEAIIHERRVELFTEWGHRWLDLKRTHKADAALGPLKPGWQSTDALYPIPKTELDKNKNLLPQNKGY